MLGHISSIEILRGKILNGQSKGTYRCSINWQRNGRLQFFSMIYDTNILFERLNMLFNILLVNEFVFWAGGLLLQINLSYA